MSLRSAARSPLAGLLLALPLLALPQEPKDDSESRPTAAPTTEMSADEATGKAIDAVLDALYGAVSFGPGGECDWELLEELVLPGATFVQPARAGEERRIIDLEGFFADFREFLAMPGVRQGGFTETIAHRRTDRFGDIAHCYLHFEAKLGGDPRPAAHGLDSIQLVRVGKDWRVASITTEFERPDRRLPARFGGGGSAGDDTPPPED